MQAVTPDSSERCAWAECPNQPPYAKTLKKCSQCQEVLYCRRKCQKANLSNHQIECLRFQFNKGALGDFPDLKVPEKDKFLLESIRVKFSLVKQAVEKLNQIFLEAFKFLSTGSKGRQLASCMGARQGIFRGLDDLIKAAEKELPEKMGSDEVQAICDTLDEGLTRIKGLEQEISLLTGSEGKS